MLGYAVSASTVAAVMSGCKADPAVIANGLDAWTPEFMSKDDGKTIAQLAECILPKTDIPGAIDAGVHSYIDLMLKNVSTKEEQEAFKAGFSDFKKQFQNAKGKSFLDANEQERVAFLTTYEKAEYDKSKQDDPPASFWFAAKELVLTGYFTSEVGAKQALVFDPVPGAYKACIPVEEVGGTWAI